MPTPKQMAASSQPHLTSPQLTAAAGPAWPARVERPRPRTLGYSPAPPMSYAVADRRPSHLPAGGSTGLPTVATLVRRLAGHPRDAGVARIGGLQPAGDTDRGRRHPYRRAAHHSPDRRSALRRPPGHDAGRPPPPRGAGADRRAWTTRRPRHRAVRDRRFGAVGPGCGSASRAADTSRGRTIRIRAGTQHETLPTSKSQIPAAFDAGKAGRHSRRRDERCRCARQQPS